VGIRFQPGDYYWKLSIRTLKIPIIFGKEILYWNTGRSKSGFLGKVYLIRFEEGVIWGFTWKQTWGKKVLEGIDWGPNLITEVSKG